MNGAMLKVTVARWFTPNGINLSKGGIAPDKEVLLSETDIRDGNDLQKAAALQLLAQ
jgi:C-terminal processing protease CtpA/Prc